MDRYMELKLVSNMFIVETGGLVTDLQKPGFKKKKTKVCLIYESQLLGLEARQLPRVPGQPTWSIWPTAS